jgi:ribonuclease P protein subunit RPR2
MGIAKTAKKAGSIPNKSLYSRISYLHQAATYLATQEGQHCSKKPRELGNENEKTHGSKPYQSISCRLIADMRNVSQKVIIRMSPAIKHSVCKSCDTLLIDGVTCSSRTENMSSGGKKPWADTLVRKCNTCGFLKRFPVASERQNRRSNRNLEVKEVLDNHVE